MQLLRAGLCLCLSLASIAAVSTAPAPARAQPAGAYRVDVHVEELGTRRPLVGIAVQLAEPQECTRNPHGGCRPAHPRHLSARTDAHGTAHFRAPRDGYTLVALRVPGYVGQAPFHNLSELERTHHLFEEVAPSTPHGVRQIVIRMVPQSALQVRDAAAAERIARAEPEASVWLARYPQAVVEAVRPGDGEWQVFFRASPTEGRAVLVNALDGSARVFGRWSSQPSQSPPLVVPGRS